MRLKSLFSGALSFALLSTADKRGIKDFLKLPSVTSFIRKTLSAIALRGGDEG